VNGYDSSGNPLSGVSPRVVTTAPFWANPTSVLTDGRMNNVGVWAMSGNCFSNQFASITEWIGFSATLNLPQSKVYYIGMAGDNQIRFRVNGVSVVEQPTVVAENFKYWHLYPVLLLEGPNFIELACKDDGQVSAAFGAEIYDNTEEELAAATQESDVRLVFSTKNYFCANVSVGTNFGYSCPSGYTIDMTGTPPMCRKRDTVAAQTTNTGYLRYLHRRRLLNGSPDGYIEDNDTSGIGPLIAPVPAPDQCVVQSIDPTPSITPSSTITPTVTPTPTITPSASQKVVSGCAIYPVGSISVENLSLDVTFSNMTFNITGLQAGLYGSGGYGQVLSISSTSCRPCVVQTGPVYFTQRGTTNQVQLSYSITSFGGVNFYGTLPAGFVYDSVFTVPRGCELTTSAGASGGGCLVRGTRITMADGSQKNIEDLAAGDRLMTLHIEGLGEEQDVDYHQWQATDLQYVPALTTVKTLLPRRVSEVVRLNGILTSSVEHKHFIRRDGLYYFERADQIRQGDYLLYERGSFIVVNSIQRMGGGFDVYNLDVEDIDVFFANGLLTHNKNISTDQSGLQVQ
jgi:hypothetical protein